jgi:hypothetical protein
MKLTDLEPTFLKIVDDKTEQMTDNIQGADGLLFLCPKCFTDNKGTVGTHYIKCWQPHVPASNPPGPGRWSFIGTNYSDLTLQASSSSISLSTGCKAHFFIRNGEIVMA